MKMLVFGGSRTDSVVEVKVNQVAMCSTSSSTKNLSFCLVSGNILIEYLCYIRCSKRCWTFSNNDDTNVVKSFAS